MTTISYDFYVQNMMHFICAFSLIFPSCYLHNSSENMYANFPDTYLRLCMRYVHFHRKSNIIIRLVEYAL